MNKVKKTSQNDKQKMTDYKPLLIRVCGVWFEIDARKADSERARDVVKFAAMIKTINEAHPRSAHRAVSQNVRSE